MRGATLGDTSDDPRSANDLVELLRRRAESQASSVAYRFLVEGEVSGQVDDLTFGALARKAYALASLLRAAGGEGERALLLYPAGLDFVAAFFGCLAGNVVAVPCYPPDPLRLAVTLPKLRAIARDCGARFILTIEAFKELAAGLSAVAPELAALRWIATDTIDFADAERHEARPISRADVAFLQYTSGSTSEPKGVMVTHGNLMANSSAIYGLAEHWRPDSVSVCWVPSYHDMGLLSGVVQPLFAGIPSVILSPLAFLERPVRWLQAMSHYRGTTSSFPNFALDLCVKKVTAEELRALDLSAWRVACNGAEPIRADSLARFSDAFAPAGFSFTAHFPAYGLAESTVMVSGRSLGSPTRAVAVDRGALREGRVTSAHGTGKILVGCGRALDAHELVIVDPETRQPKGDDQIGEIWFRGPSVAVGYWGRDDETRETFEAHLAAGDGPFLRTGDLGFLRGGELYVTGRRKDLVILRGKNHYPQDLELTAERAHVAVRPGCVVAFAVDEADGEEQLALALEVQNRGGAPCDFEAVVTTVREAVAAEHGVTPATIVLLEPRALAKTSSGKLRRGECKRLLVEQALGALHTWRAPVPAAIARLDAGALRALALDARAEALEQYLAARAADALGLLTTQIDRTLPLRDFGLDSLTAVSFQGDLERELGVSLSLSALLQDAGGIHEIARDLARQMQATDVAPGEATPATLSDAGVHQEIITLLEQEEARAVATVSLRAVSDR